MKNLTVFGLAILIGMAVPAYRADAGNCEQCGRKCPTKKVCVPVMTTKMVQYDGWNVVCEDLAVPLKRTCACGADGSCGQEGCDGDSECGHARPCTCAKCRIRPRNRLMRRTLIQRVPVVRYVVVDACDSCCQGLAPVYDAADASAVTSRGDWSAPTGPRSARETAIDDDRIGGRSEPLQAPVVHAAEGVELPVVPTSQDSVARPVGYNEVEEEHESEDRMPPVIDATDFRQPTEKDGPGRPSSAMIRLLERLTR